MELCSVFQDERVSSPRLDPTKGVEGAVGPPLSPTTQLPNYPMTLMNFQPPTLWWPCGDLVGHLHAAPETRCRICRWHNATGLTISPPKRISAKKEQGGIEILNHIGIIYNRERGSTLGLQPGLIAYSIPIRRNNRVVGLTVTEKMLQTFRVLYNCWIITHR